MNETYSAGYKPTHRTCRDGSEVQPLELLGEWFDENRISQDAAGRAMDLIDHHAADQANRAAVEAIMSLLGALEGVNSTGAALSWLLRSTPETQGQLAARLGFSQQSISKQINVLRVRFADWVLPDRIEGL